MLAHGIKDRPVGVGALRRRQKLLGQHHRTEPHRFAGAHRAAGDVELGETAAFQMAGENCADIRLAHRGSGGDAGIPRLALNIGNNEIGFAGQRVAGVEHAATAIRQHEPAAFAPCLGDAVRPSAQQQRARG